MIDRLNSVPRTVTPDPRPATALLAEAVALADWADVVILAIGEAKEHTGEAASRAEIGIPAPQRRLFEALASRLAEAGKPLVALVLAGRPLVLGDLPARANAVLYAWFGGTEMGNGIADLLLGRAEPTARLAASLPRHGGQAPLAHGLHQGGRPWPGEWRKFTTAYIDLPDGAHPARGLYPFGHGLAYTRFSFGPPEPERTELTGPDDRIVLTVRVRNEGARNGTAVVQLYVSDPVARIARPAQELKGVVRLTLAPGEEARARFSLGRDDLAYAFAEPDGRVRRVWDPGEVILRTGPDAANTQSASLRWEA